MRHAQQPATFGDDRMDSQLSPAEKTLVDYAQEAVIRYNRMRHAHGGIDTLYAFVLEGGL